MNIRNKKKERFKRFKSQRLDRWNRGAITIAIIAGIVGICNICFTGFLNYKLNKLNYSPQLVVTNCQITDFKDNRLATTQYTVTIETKLKNIGNNNAHLLIYSFGVLPTGEDYFRTVKDSNKFSSELKNAGRIYYSDREVFPNQELDGPTLISGINKDQIITGISSIGLKELLLPTDSIFTAHFWFAYTNDKKDVYDTYFWYTAKITNDPKNPVKFVSKSYSFQIYNSCESKKLIADFKYSKLLKRSIIPF